MGFLFKSTWRWKAFNKWRWWRYNHNLGHFGFSASLFLYVWTRSNCQQHRFFLK